MRFLKFFAAGLGVLLAVILVAFVVIAVTFDPNDYKGYAQDWVEQRTGRSLRIDGDIELSFFPWLAVQTAGVELGNAPGFGPEPFLAARRMSARIRLLPLLLRREFEIGTVSIDGLELDLAADSNGSNNWNDLLGGGTAQPQPTEADNDGNEAASAGGLAALDVEGIELRGARMVWRENGEPRFIVSELSLSTGAINVARPVDIDVELDVLEVPTQRNTHLAATTTAAIEDDGAIRATDTALEFRLDDGAGNTDAQGEASIDSLEFVPGERVRTGPVRLVNTMRVPLRETAPLAAELGWTSLDVDLATMSAVVEDLEAAANDVRARWQLVGENLTSDAAVVRGSVVIDDTPAASALELAGMTLPENIDAAALGRFTASTGFVVALDSQDIELSNLDVTMLGIDVRMQQAALTGDGLSAQLDVAPFRPNAALLQVLAPWIPEGWSLEQLGTIALSTRVSGTAENFEITGMRFSGLGAELNGQLRLEQRDEGLRISGDIATNRFAPGEMLAIAGSILPESVTPETTGMLSAAGQFAYSTGTGALDVTGLRIEAFGMRATGAVAGSGVGQSMAEFSGRVQVEDFAPRDLLARFGLAVPATSDESALRRANVASRFEITPASAAFDELVVNLDDSRLSGSFLVSTFEDPLYRFELSAERFDVDRYLPPQTPPGADDEPQTDDGERRAGDIELSREALSAINVDADISVGELRLAGMDFSNVATSLIVGGGRMLLDSAHADLYGGTFDGRFHADASGDTATMLLQGNARSLALQPLITALAGNASFSGTGSFDIDLRGTGPTVTDNLRGAAGTMGFELTNGAIEGFNVDKTLCRAFNRARGNPAPTDQPDRTPFEYIRGTADVEDGIAASDDLIAVVGSAEVRGSGTLALAEQITDYRFEARLARTVPIPGCEEMERIVGHDFPLEMKGPLTAPEISPDYSEVMRRVLEYRLREEVRDRLLEGLFD
jgi:AsmA protein